MGRNKHRLWDSWGQQAPGQRAAFILAPPDAGTFRRRFAVAMRWRRRGSLFSRGSGTLTERRIQGCTDGNV